MTGIVFYFEKNDKDVYSGRRIDLDAWNYAIKAAGDITKVIVINKTSDKLRSPDFDLDFLVVDDLPELTGKVAYIMCPWNSAETLVPLWNFDHNVDWYVFGSAGGWADNKKEFGVYVPQNGNAALHSVHIATTVMLHRYWTRNSN